MRGSDARRETAREILDRRKALDDGERHRTDRRERLAFRTSQREQVFDFTEKRFPRDERKSTLVFVSPAIMRGTSVLSFSHRGREGEHWIQRSARDGAPRRVSSSRREPFWGTDLTPTSISTSWRRWSRGRKPTPRRASTARNQGIPDDAFTQAALARGQD